MHYWKRASPAGDGALQALEVALVDDAVTLVVVLVLDLVHDAAKDGLGPFTAVQTGAQLF